MESNNKSNNAAKKSNFFSGVVKKTSGFFGIKSKNARAKETAQFITDIIFDILETKLMKENQKLSKYANEDVVKIVYDEIIQYNFHHEDIEKAVNAAVNADFSAFIALPNKEKVNVVLSNVLKVKGQEKIFGDKEVEWMKNDICKKVSEGKDFSYAAIEEIAEISSEDCKRMKIRKITIRSIFYRELGDEFSSLSTKDKQIMVDEAYEIASKSGGFFAPKSRDFSRENIEKAVEKTLEMFEIEVPLGSHADRLAKNRGESGAKKSNLGK